jgi:hypothetical protein
LTSMRSRCLLGESYGGYFEVILLSSVPLRSSIGSRLFCAERI